jgi:hypothetical protein
MHSLILSSAAKPRVSKDRPEALPNEPKVIS